MLMSCACATAAELRGGSDKPARWEEEAEGDTAAVAGTLSCIKKLWPLVPTLCSPNFPMVFRVCSVVHASKRACGVQKGSLRWPIASATWFRGACALTDRASTYHCWRVTRSSCRARHSIARIRRQSSVGRNAPPLCHSSAAPRCCQSHRCAGARSVEPQLLELRRSVRCLSIARSIQLRLRSHSPCSVRSGRRTRARRTDE